MSKHIYVPTQSVDDWKKLLADPDNHWRSGYSARALAHCWEDSKSFPDEIEKIFKQAGFENLKLLLAIPEHKVYLPPRGHPSQNDLFILAKTENNSLMSIAVEGKVTETFGETLEKWNAEGSASKKKRFSFLANLLNLDSIPKTIRYQLLHRSASAILEAQKFNAKYAVMLVHSFSPELLWLEDFQDFAELFGVKAQSGQLYFVRQLDGIDFYLAWAKGDSKYLSL